VKRLAAAAIIGLLAKSASADTPPNVWDLAKNPNAYQQWREHVRLSQSVEMLDELKEIGGRTNETHRAAALATAQAALDESVAPKTPWLLYDQAAITMARAGILKSPVEWQKAIDILEPLTKSFDGMLFGQEVWLKLAECYVQVERTPDEIRAYEQVIARAVVPEGTITPLLNQGEAYMRAGDVDAAVPQFREVYRLAGMSPTGNEVGVLAQWDLALALDRSGDEHGALAAAKTATHMDAHCLAVNSLHKVVAATKCNVGDDIGDGTTIAFVIVPQGLFPVSEQNDSVYFVPAYERAWYLALGRQALALDAPSAKEAADHWKWAETEMMTYVSQATIHTGDKWLDLAKKRLDAIRKRRLEADKRAGVTRLDL
jgi:tetratricopeptide (TPR) repeat protein